MTNFAAEQKSTFYRWVLLLSLLAAVLWVLIVPTQPFSDFLYYHELAGQIAHGGEWGDTYTAVGYPIFLALFYRIFGAKLLVAKVLNLALFLLSNLLVLGILRRTRAPETLRRIIFLIFVLFPINIYYTSIVGTELFFTALLLLDLWLYLGDTRYKYVLIGVVTGLGSMVKPFFPAFVLVVFLTELLIGRRLWEASRKASVVLIVTVLMITPWLYRNFRLVGEFTYISNNSGIVLYINNNSQNITGGWMPAADVENSLVNTSEYEAANMTQKNKMLSRAAKQWIKTHPEEFVALGLKRLFSTYFMPNYINYSLNGTNASKLTSNLLTIWVELIRFPVYILGSVAAFVRSLRYLKSRIRRRPPAIAQALAKAEICMLLVFWMFAGVYFITEGQPRYAFPSIFIMIYFACQAVSNVLAAFQPESGKP